jgi:hypothetical protein
MLAHHEALVILQAAAPLGLTGWAAVIGARWYSLCRRPTSIGDLTHTHDRSTESSTSDQGTP